MGKGKGAKKRINFGSGSTISVQGNPIPDRFTFRLEHLLKPCVIEENSDIAGIAEMLGTSPRTLQRRLTEEGTSYSEIVQRVRYHTAALMLRDSNLRVIDVAVTLGYEDASHFSRFFRRVAGVTPRHFRSRYREGKFDYQAAG